MSTASYGACGKDGCGCLHFDVASDDKPKLCDCGHMRCFHAAVTAGRGTPRSGRKSVSELVAPIFYREVNNHLTENLSHSLPKCGLTDFRTHEVEGPNDEILCEIDTFGYMDRS